ncbi:MAG: hypothetical protein ABEK50_18400, partial [bacterium]
LMFGLVSFYSVLLIILPYVYGSAYLWILLLWGLFFFAGQPVMNTLVSRVGSEATHGRMYGLAFTMNLGFGGLASYVCGYMIDHLSLQYSFGLLGILGLLVAFLITRIDL